MRATRASAYHDREAELQARVDRRRVRLVHAGAGDGGLLGELVGSFRAEVEGMDGGTGEAEIDLIAECVRGGA